MERIKGISETGPMSERQREVLQTIDRLHRGQTGGSFPMLLHSPEAALRVADLGSYLRFATKFDAQDRELLYLMVARETGCQSIWSAHVELGLKAGLSGDDIDLIRYGRERELTGRSGLLASFAHQLLATARVDADIFDELLKAYGLAQTVDLVTLFGYIVMQACLHNCFEIAPSYPDRLTLGTKTPHMPTVAQRISGV